MRSECSAMPNKISSSQTLDSVCFRKAFAYEKKKNSDIVKILSNLVIEHLSEGT